MKEKKTEVITFRTESWVKEALNAIAEENKWSIAQTVDQLCKNFIVNPRPEQITIKTKNLIDRIKDIEEEGIEKATHLNISLEYDEENDIYYKELNFEVWECGGLVCCPDFEPIKELTEEEIRQIP